MRRGRKKRRGVKRIGGGTKVLNIIREKETDKI